MSTNQKGGNTMRKITIALAGTAVGVGSVLSSQPASAVVTLEPLTTVEPDWQGLASWQDVPSFDDTVAPGTWFEGDPVTIRWGTVQVKVKLDGNKATDVAAMTMPVSDNFTKNLSKHVASTLRWEVLQAQSAEVDMISGATYSSQAYLTSLQSALDKAQVELVPVQDSVLLAVVK